MTIERQLLLMLIPEEILLDFDVTKVEDTLEVLTIELVEKETAISKLSISKQLVFNGYLNPLELQHFPMNGKRCVLRLVRRRWKEQGSNSGNYCNTYSFAVTGTKVTPPFGAFLKEISQ